MLLGFDGLTSQIRNGGSSSLDCGLIQVIIPNEDVVEIAKRLVFVAIGEEEVVPLFSGELLSVAVKMQERVDLAASYSHRLKIVTNAITKIFDLPVAMGNSRGDQGHKAIVPQSKPGGIQHGEKGIVRGGARGEMFLSVAAEHLVQPGHIDPNVTTNRLNGGHVVLNDPCIDDAFPKQVLFDFASQMLFVEVNDGLFEADRDEKPYDDS